MAAGDYVVYRNNANTDEIPDAGSDLLTLWDTEVDSRGSISYSSGVFTLGETGRFLVLWSDQWGTTDTTSNERTNVRSGLYLAGTLLKEGRGTGYVRRLSGSQEFVNFSAAVIEVTTTTGDGDELELRLERIDNSTAGTVNRIAERSSVSILKLDDNWGYARYESSAAFTPSATDNVRTTANIQTELEESGPFARTTNTVNIQTDRLVLAVYGFYNDDTDTVSGRTEMQGVLDLEGTEIFGSWSQTYGPRATDNNDWGGMCNVSLLTPTAGDDLTLELVSREDADEDWYATLQLVELPDAAKAIIVQVETAAGNLNSNGANRTWATNPYIDTDKFTHTVATDAVDVDEAGDYLAMYALAVIADAGVTGTRMVPSTQFRVNTTDTDIGGSSSYSRASGTADHPGVAAAGLLTSLSANDTIYVRQERIGTQSNAAAAIGGMGVIHLASLFTQHLTGSGRTTLDGVDGYIDKPGVSLGTGDKTLIVYFRKDDYTPTGNEVVFGQFDTGAANRSDRLQFLATSGNLQYTIHDGTTGRSWTIVNPGFTDGQGLWLKLDIDVDTGASDADLAGYVSFDPPDTAPGDVNWGAQRFNPTNPGSAIVPQAITTDITIGAENSVTPINFFDGDIYYVGYWRDGLESAGGTLAFEYDARPTAPDASDELADGVSGVWTHYDGWTHEGGVFTPGLSFGVGEVSSSVGGQTLTGTLFTPTLTFPTGSVTPQPVTLTGALFAPGLTFNAGTVTAGPVTLTGSLFTPGLTFETGSVTVGAVTLTGVLFTPTLSFGVGVVTAGSVTITGSLFTPGLAFGTGSVTSGSVTLTGSLFAPSLTFGAGSVTTGAVTLTGTLFTPSLVFGAGTVTTGAVTLTGILFSPGLTFGTGTVTAGASTLTGALFTPGLVFGAGTVTPGAVTITGTVFAPGLVFGAGSLFQGQNLTGTLFTPSLTFPAGTVTPQAVTVTGTTFTPTLSFPQGAAQAALRGALFAPTLTFSTGTVTTTVTVTGAVLAPTLNFGTGTVSSQGAITGATTFTPSLAFGTGSVEQPETTLTGTVFTPSLSFPAGVASFGAGGTLFQPTLSFPTGTVTPQPVTVTGSLFTPSLAFGAGAVTNASTITGTVFTPDLQFPAGVVDTETTITGTLFTPSLLFGTGEIQPQPVTVTGSLFTPGLVFPAGSVAATLTGTLFAPALTFGTGNITAGAVTITGTLFTPTLTFGTGKATIDGSWWQPDPTAHSKDPVAHTLDPVDYSKDPVAHSKDPVGFTKVKAGDTAPWN